jgi:hypothetical protein
MALLDLRDRKKLAYFGKEAILIVIYSSIIFLLICFLRFLSWISIKLHIFGTASSEQIVLRWSAIIHSAWAIGSLGFLAVASLIKLVILLIGSLRNEA